VKLLITEERMYNKNVSLFRDRNLDLAHTLNRRLKL